MELEENLAIKEIQTIFESDDTEKIHDSIAYIHEYGSIKMLPLLFDLLSQTTNDTIKKEIVECLSDTKDKNSVPLFIQALRDENYSLIQKDLLTAMWQANLDFSNYISDFIDIVANAEFDTAIEAFTLTEICVQNISVDEKVQFRTLISTVLQSKKDSKLLYQTLELFK